jgi:hypothetical protein
MSCEEGTEIEGSEKEYGGSLSRPWVPSEASEPQRRTHTIHDIETQKLGCCFMGLYHSMKDSGYRLAIGPGRKSDNMDRHWMYETMNWLDEIT